jgi:hypothetical protein
VQVQVAVAGRADNLEGHDTSSVRHTVGIELRSALPKRLHESHSAALRPLGAERFSAAKPHSPNISVAGLGALDEDDDRSDRTLDDPARRLELCGSKPASPQSGKNVGVKWLAYTNGAGPRVE